MQRFYSERYDSLPYSGSDLALERRRADTECEGVSLNEERTNGFLWQRIEVSSAEGEKSIGRPRGNYDTLTTLPMNLLDEGEIEDAAEEIARELCNLCERNRIKPERILVVGLGNRSLTPDSLGPLTVELINPTMHIKDMDKNMFYTLDCMEIALCAPGTLYESGFDAFDTVSALCKSKSPDLVIAIDSLAARSKERLGCTIQMCDTGIFPGSGIGNGRIALNEDTLDTPVIAIGIPTVIDSEIFVMESTKNYSAQDKKTSKSNDSMFVSPKDIDVIVKNGAKIISLAINQAFGIVF